jgi:hypothetical protein
MRAVLSWLRRSSIAIVTLAVVVATVWFSLPSAGPVSKRLGEAARVKQAVVDVSQLTDFGWTEMVVFPSYYPQAAACRALALAEPDCSRLVDGLHSDMAQLLAFRDGGRVVHVEHHTVTNGSIVMPPGRTDRPMVLPRERARFVVHDEFWALAEPAPAASAPTASAPH